METRIFPPAQCLIYVAYMIIYTLYINESQLLSEMSRLGWNMPLTIYSTSLPPKNGAVILVL